jgi:hypothetical protein
VLPVVAPPPKMRLSAELTGSANCLAFEENSAMQARKLSVSPPAGMVQTVRRVIAPISKLLSVALLVSCTSFSTFDEALPLLKGENISKSINYLGIPDRKYEIDDMEIYVWSTEEDFTHVDPVVSSMHGYAGATPFSANSTSYESSTSRLSCEIKMSTRRQIVERIEYSGNNGACFKYSERLKPLLEAK